jgi:hypothetical protein
MKITNIKNNHNHNHIQYTITASTIVSYVTVSTTCSSTTQYCSTVASKLNTHLSSSISIYAGIVSLAHLSNPATTSTTSNITVCTSTSTVEATQDGLTVDSSVFLRRGGAALQLLINKLCIYIETTQQQQQL